MQYGPCFTCYNCITGIKVFLLVFDSFRSCVLLALGRGFLTGTGLLCDVQVLRSRLDMATLGRDRITVWQLGRDRITVWQEGRPC